MRTSAVLVLVTLAVVAAGVFVDAPGWNSAAVSTTSDGRTGAPSDSDSLVWGDRVFSSEDEFTAWLAQRDASYSDWVERHPGAAPWEEGGGAGWGTFALLLAALGGILVYLVRARETAPPLARGTVTDLARGARRAFPPSPWETMRSSAAERPAFSVRNATLPYGRSSYKLGPQHAAKPQLVAASFEASLTEEAPLESVAAAAPEPERNVVELAPDRAALTPGRESAVDAALRRVWTRARAGVQGLWPETASPPPVARAGSELRLVQPAPFLREVPGAEPANGTAGLVLTVGDADLDRPAVESMSDPSAANGAAVAQPLPEEEPASGPTVVEAPPAPAAEAGPVAFEPDEPRIVAAEAVPVEPADEAEPADQSASHASMPEPEPVPIPLEPPPVAPPPVVPPPAEAQRPEASHGESFRGVACEIALWRGYVKARFYARFIGGDPLAAIAMSPMFRCRSAMPDETEEPAAALSALVDHLVADGWELSGQGAAWYARRLTRDAGA